MQRGLFERLGETVPEGCAKHEHFDAVFRAYLRAWTEGAVERSYVGRGQNPEQATFYIDKQTVEALGLIAQADGTATSHVVRTAVVWWLTKDGNGAGIDADELLGPRPALKLAS